MWNLMVVEDEAIVRIGLRYMLDWEALGICWKSEASNGVEALELMKQSEIHIVMTDIRMPGMDGLELARAIKAIDEKVQIIFISSYEDFPYVKEAVRIGVVDYLHKPTMEKNEIEQTLKKAIDNLQQLQVQAQGGQELDLEQALLAQLMDSDWALQWELAWADPRMLKFAGGYRVIRLQIEEAEEEASQANNARFNSFRYFVEEYVSHDWGGLLLSRDNQELIGLLPRTTLKGGERDLGSYLDYLGQQLLSMLNLQYTCTFSSLRLEGDEFREAYEQCVGEAELHAANSIGSIARLAMSYVEQHLLDEVSLAKAAESIPVSAGHLSRVFLKETGEHFSEYVTRKKINYAKRLLRETNRKVYDIASELGYANPHYFSKLFKDETGITPLEFRNQ